MNPFKKVTFHINALRQKDSILITDPSWPHFERAYFVYNSHGNPEYKVYEAGFDTTVHHRTKTVYYYEDYDPSLWAGNESTAYSSAHIYPNPANRRLFVEASDIREVEISDLTGKRALAEPYTSDGIDISRLHDGLYIVKLVGRSGITVVKLVKHE